MLRTQPDIPVFQSEQIQSMMTRILFIWAVRHPASAYVQGINDLCAPLLLVFLSECVMKADQQEEQLFNNTKQMKQVSRLIKNNIIDKLERSSGSKPQKPSIEEDQDLFNPLPIEKLLKSKNRKSIYDIKEEDFFRIKRIRQQCKHLQKEDMEEHMEEVGDVDPERINSINL